jgi:hypothetical protein
MMMMKTKKDVLYKFIILLKRKSIYVTLYKYFWFPLNLIANNIMILIILIYIKLIY